MACFTRQRYGTNACPAERLPADQVEYGVIDSLLATVARTDLIDAALDGAHQQAAGERDARVSELAAVESEIAKTEASIDRYLTAFENATMPEATCGPRLEALSHKANELRGRRDELVMLIEETPPRRHPPARTSPLSQATSAPNSTATPRTRSKRSCTR